MICVNCGSKIDDNSLNCPHCGAKLNAGEQTEAGMPNYKGRRIFFGTIAVLGIVTFVLFYAAYIYSLCGLEGPLGFLKEWADNSISRARMFVLIGMLLVMINSATLLASFITGKTVRSIPWIGGVMVAVGFILSPSFKVLALLGLFDLGIWEFTMHIISDYQRNKRFYSYLEEFGGPGDEEILDENGSYKKSIDILHGAKHFTVPYRPANPYWINNLDLRFAVIYDGGGKRFLVLDTVERGPMPIPMPVDRLTVGNVKIKGKTDDLVFDIFSYND